MGFYRACMVAKGFTTEGSLAWEISTLPKSETSFQAISNCSTRWVTIATHSLKLQIISFESLISTLTLIGNHF